MSEQFKPFVRKSFTLNDFDEVPWGKYASHGDIRALDDATTQDFTEDDVEHVIAYSDVAGLVLLKDGRYLSWESWHEVTGSGFHADAYGGDQEVMVSLDPITAIRGIPENNRESLVFATRDEEEPLVNVLWDAHSGGASKQWLIDIACESGEFGDLVEHRVDELIRRWPPAEALCGIG